MAYREIIKKRRIEVDLDAICAELGLSSLKALAKLVDYNYVFMTRVRKGMFPITETLWNRIEELRRLNK